MAQGAPGRWLEKRRCRHLIVRAEIVERRHPLRRRIEPLRRLTLRYGGQARRQMKLFDRPQIYEFELDARRVGTYSVMQDPYLGFVAVGNDKRTRGFVD